MVDDHQFCLRWNNHQNTLISAFDTLLVNETLVDCTLAAEGKFLKAHKVVLSACSPYFATLLQEQYDKHPIFILQDVKYEELRAMMDYMYRGEVSIPQDQLAALLKATESLQIKGLSDNRYTLEQSRRARITGAGVPAMETAEMGSREGSSSPSRRRRKVRRRSIENAMTDVQSKNSNSSQQPTQSNPSGLGAITAAASALAAAAAAVSQTSATLASTVVPLSTNQQASSSAAIVAPGTTLSSSKKTDIIKGSTQQQDAMNIDNVQGPAASVATATPAMDINGTDAKVGTDNLNHKQQKAPKDSAAASVSGPDLVIEPQSEYDNKANGETVENLTLDEEDIVINNLDHNSAATVITSPSVGSAINKCNTSGIGSSISRKSRLLKISLRRINLSRLIKSDNPPYICDRCPNKIYKTERNLLRHKRFECQKEPQQLIKSDTLPYICARCPNKTYQSKYKLLRHKRVECHKDPQYVCALCSLGFYYLSDLKTHAVRTHIY